MHSSNQVDDLNDYINVRNDNPVYGFHVLLAYLDKIL